MPQAKALVDVVSRELLDGSGRIMRYLNRQSIDAHDAADIYQEAIVRVLEQAHEQPIRNPVGYAIRVARNLLIKKPAFQYTDDQELPCPAPSPEDRADHAQRVENLTAFLNSMPPLRRRVFIRRRLHNESRDAIAKGLGISQESVKKHMTRALSDLQRYLDERG